MRRGVCRPPARPPAPGDATAVYLVRTIKATQMDLKPMGRGTCTSLASAGGMASCAVQLEGRSGGNSVEDVEEDVEEDEAWRSPPARPPARPPRGWRPAGAPWGGCCTAVEEEEDEAWRLPPARPPARSRRCHGGVSCQDHQGHADGLETDATMYGCLMKFEVECGHTGLAQQLSEEAPSLGIQYYMSLIRAAGRDTDVDIAFAVFDKLMASGLVVVRAAYNSVSDVCASAGDVNRAHTLVVGMWASISVDIITCEVLLKSYCVKNDPHGGRNLLKEMGREGYAPNDVSFNCPINAAVCVNCLQDAWGLIDMMEPSGMAIDHFAVSIMMKSLKKLSNPNKICWSLALLDRSGLDASSDEIMLCTVLETCFKHREFQRLQAILSRYGHQSMLPSAHTYAVLIKAYGVLKLVDGCYKMWNELVVTRAIEPSDLVLGCMLDALACNHHVDEAGHLYIMLTPNNQLNIVICSTPMKSFANCRLGDLAFAARSVLVMIGGGGSTPCNETAQCVGLCVVAAGRGVVVGREGGLV